MGSETKLFRCPPVSLVLQETARRKHCTKDFITQLKVNLTFACPYYIVSIIVNDGQQDTTILAYLFIPNQLYMFWAMPSPIIRSTWLYLQHLILSTDIAAGCCHGCDGNLIHDNSRQQYRWTTSEAVNTVKCSLWWAKTSPEKCGADQEYINKPKLCILLVVIYSYSFTKFDSKQHLHIYIYI